MQNITEPKLSIQDVAKLLGMSRQAVHSKINKLGLTCYKSGRVAYITHKIGKKLFNIKNLKLKIALQHIKGGIGKTIATDNLGDFLSVLGLRVLKIDADFQKNLTGRYGITSDDAEKVPVLIDLLKGNGSLNESIIQVSEGVDLLPSRFENATIDSVLYDPKFDLSTVFSKLFEPIEQNYDVVIIDCPAMLGKLVTAITLYCDKIILPLNPDSFSIEGLQTIKREYKNIEISYNTKIKYKVFLNKFESNTILSNSDITTVISRETDSGTGFDHAVIKSQEVTNAVGQGKSLFSYVKQSDVRNDFIEIGKRIIQFDTISQPNTQLELT